MSDLEVRQAQELVDRVVQHMIKQNAKALDCTCVYHAENGRKCAIGCLIDEEHYEPNFEGTEFSDVDVTRAVELSIGRPLNIKELHILPRLQNTHDGLDPKEWPAELASLCSWFGLEYHPHEPQ